MQAGLACKPWDTTQAAVGGSSAEVTSSSSRMGQSCTQLGHHRVPADGLPACWQASAATLLWQVQTFSPQCQAP